MKAGRRHLFRRFVKDTEAVAAVEFGIIIVPLMVLLFAIIEYGMMFFVNAVLENSVDEYSRIVRTGQAAESSMGLSAAKSEICSNMMALFSCQENLHLIVSVVTDISSVTSVNAFDVDGEFKDVDVYDIGEGKDYILVQAYLPWKSFFRSLGASVRMTSDDAFILGAVQLFRNEPF